MSGPPLGSSRTGTASSPTGRGTRPGWPQFGPPESGLRRSRAPVTQGGRPSLSGRPCASAGRPPGPGTERHVRPRDPHAARLRATPGGGHDQAIGPRPCDDGERTRPQEGQRIQPLAPQFLAPEDRRSRSGPASRRPRSRTRGSARSSRSWPARWSPKPISSSRQPACGRWRA